MLTKTWHSLVENIRQAQRGLKTNVCLLLIRANTALASVNVEYALNTHPIYQIFFKSKTND